MATDSFSITELDASEQRSSSPAGAGALNRLAGIEFRHLRYFVVVAEELHFQRAAARLYISQPGLSQAIARLERELEVPLFIRTRSNVELTAAGAELLHHARGLLTGLRDAVTRVRMAGRGEAGLIRVGVALLAEQAAAPALRAFQEENPAIVIDRSAMVSERLLAQLAEGGLNAAVVHHVPALALAEPLAWELLRRGRLAVLASPGGDLAHRDGVALSELRNQRFLVNPRSLAPAAFEGLKLMCCEFGGFDPAVLESPAASTAALDTAWQPIRDGAVAVMAEAAARAICPPEVAVIPIQPPPQYALTLAWRRDDNSPAAHRFLSHMRTYRDQHAWVMNPEPALLP